MKVNKWCSSTDAESHELFIHPANIASTSYGSTEEHQAALAAEMVTFKEKLDDIISEAYGLGYATGHHHGHKTV